MKVRDRAAWRVDQDSKIRFKVSSSRSSLGQPYSNVVDVQSAVTVLLDSAEAAVASYESSLRSSGDRFKSCVLPLYTYVVCSETTIPQPGDPVTTSLPSQLGSSVLDWFSWWTVDLPDLSTQVTVRDELTYSPSLNNEVMTSGLLPAALEPWATLLGIDTSTPAPYVVADLSALVGTAVPRVAVLGDVLMAHGWATGSNIGWLNYEPALSSFTAVVGAYLSSDFNNVEVFKSFVPEAIQDRMIWQVLSSPKIVPITKKVYSEDPLVPHYDEPVSAREIFVEKYRVQELAVELGWSIPGLT